MLGGLVLEWQMQILEFLLHKHGFWPFIDMVAHTNHPALRRLRQEDREYGASLDYTIRLSPPGKKN